MPTYPKSGWNITTIYKDGTEKVSGPYSFAVAQFFALTIAMKPWVLFTEVTRA